MQSIEAKIALAWSRVIYRKQIFVSDKCSLCKKRKITTKQEVFLQLMKEGCSLEEIRDKMDMKYKTFYSVKQQIKRGFSLKTDYELLQFCTIF
jgi:DNA-binding CsgD family transcriptional regulator